MLVSMWKHVMSILFRMRPPDLCRMWTGESAQDLIEYVLLLAFVCIAALGIFVVNGGDIVGVWVSTNALLSQASNIAIKGQGS
jgi:hypothetical protein